jgi:muconolactone D-isomerase
MNKIQVILTLDMANLQDNFQEILKEEQAMVAQWKADGILEHLFLRQTKNGAVLIFKDLDETQVRAHMEHLPFSKIAKSIEYFALIQQF